MMQCADPRDRLYALLSLDESCSISPDYTRSAASVYIEFAKELVDKGVAHMVLAKDSRSAAKISSQTSFMVIKGSLLDNS